MSWIKKKNELQELARQIDKSIILTTKDSWFWKIIATVLDFFHIIPKEHFLKYYATTIGPVQSYPKEWLASTVKELIPHESDHVCWFKRFGFMISPWLGIPLMGILYLFAFFPIFFAWCRYRLELSADKKRWEWMLNQGIPITGVIQQAEDFADSVSSWGYGKSLPKFWVMWGFRRALSKLTIKRAFYVLNKLEKKYGTHND